MDFKKSNFVIRRCRGNQLFFIFYNARRKKMEALFIWKGARFM